MMKNMMCQFAWSMMMPATVGPMAGANAITMLNSPMAVPRFSTGNVSMRTVMTMGMRMPAPAACTRRPSSSTGKLGPQPANRLPHVNMAMDARNRPRVEKRSVRKAVMGIMMAFTSVNPVVSHWAVEASTPISIMTDGKAGVTTVWFSTVTNVPKISTAIINFCLLVSPMVRFLFT